MMDLSTHPSPDVDPRYVDSEGALPDAVTSSQTPRPLPRKGVRAVTILVGLVFLAIFVTNLATLYVVRDQELQRAGSESETMATSAAEQLEGLIAEASQVLSHLGFGLGRTGLNPRALDHARALLANQIENSGLLGAAYIYDAKGELVASSSPALERLGHRHAVADRDYFSFHRDGQSTTPRIDPPLLGRATNEWVIPFSRRIQNSSGEFLGVAVVTVRIASLQRWAGHLAGGVDSELLVLLSDRVLITKANAVTTTSVSEPQAEAWTTWLQRLNAIASQATSPLDGRLRIYSPRATANAPFKVIVGLDREGLLAEWRAFAALQGAWLFLLAAILSFALRRLNRSYRRHLDDEARIRSARDELRLANAELSRLARYDGLTGLANRGYFDETLRRTFRQARRQQRHLAVVLIDVDEFKKFNDTYGHVAGDQCLRQVAAAFKKVIARPEDLVARYGGEEMAILLPETDAHGATLIAEAARKAVTSLGIPHRQSRIGHVTVSLGVGALIPGRGSQTEDILKCADVALYRAKNLGRNNVQVSIQCD